MQIIAFLMSNIPIYKFLEPIQRIENLTGQFITVFIWSALYFAYHFFEKSRNQELSNLQLEAAKQKAEKAASRRRVAAVFRRPRRGAVRPRCAAAREGLWRALRRQDRK